MSLFLKDEAYEQLVQMIDDGKFEYDKKYSLNQIAIELNMSKTPVRDAIQKLAEEKRIDILPSRGIQLHMPTADEVKQHYHFSNAIEGYCVAVSPRCVRRSPSCTPVTSSSTAPPTRFSTTPSTSTPRA